MHCKDIPHFFYSLIDGHAGCFYFGVVMINACYTYFQINLICFINITTKLLITSNKHLSLFLGPTIQETIFNLLIFTFIYQNELLLFFFQFRPNLLVLYQRREILSTVPSYPYFVSPIFQIILQVFVISISSIQIATSCNYFPQLTHLG